MASSGERGRKGNGGSEGRGRSGVRSSSSTSNGVHSTTTHSHMNNNGSRTSYAGSNNNADNSNNQGFFGISSFFQGFANTALPFDAAAVDKVSPPTSTEDLLGDMNGTGNVRGNIKIATGTSTASSSRRRSMSPQKVRFSESSLPTDLWDATPPINTTQQDNTTTTSPHRISFSLKSPSTIRSKIFPKIKESAAYHASKVLSFATGRNGSGWNVLEDDNQSYSNEDDYDGDDDNFGFGHDIFGEGTGDADADANKGTYDDFETIDWMRDYIRERRIEQKVRENYSSEARYMLATFFDTAETWIIVILTAICIAIVAMFMDVSTRWLSDFKLGRCRSGWYLTREQCCQAYEANQGRFCDDWDYWSFEIFHIKSDILGVVNYPIYVFWAVVFATSASILVTQLAPYAAGSGIPELKTILGGFIMSSFLGMKTLLVKMVGLPLAVASGICVGKEGPMLHVSGCVASAVINIFKSGKIAKNEAKQREVLSAACAAGISVAFGAPIGGVLFSLEELSSFFPIRTLWLSFLCAFVAGIFLKVLIRSPTSNSIMFDVKFDREWHFFELVFFAGLGVLGGLLGALLIRMNLQIQAFRRKSRSKTWIGRHPIIEVAMIAVVTSAISYFNVFMRVDQTELLTILFRECQDDVDSYFQLCDQSATARIVFLLVMAFFLKLFATIVTFGVKIPSGIFIPSMVLGACLGRVMGIIVEAVSRAAVQNGDTVFFKTCTADTPCVTPGTYALLGAMGTLAGVTRMTLSLTVIMFELTGKLSYVVPCMLTIVIAKVVGEALVHESLADGAIRLANLPYLDQKTELSDWTQGGDFDRFFIMGRKGSVQSVRHLLAIASSKSSIHAGMNIATVPEESPRTPLSGTPYGGSNIKPVRYSTESFSMRSSMSTDIQLPLELDQFAMTAFSCMTPIEEVVCFTKTGMTIGSMIRCLQNTSLQGYPIVRSQTDKRLVGFVERRDVIYGLEKMLPGPRWRKYASSVAGDVYYFPSVMESLSSTSVAGANSTAHAGITSNMMSRDSSDYYQSASEDLRNEFWWDSIRITFNDSNHRSLHHQGSRMSLRRQSSSVINMQMDPSPVSPQQPLQDVTIRVQETSNTSPSTEEEAQERAKALKSVIDLGRYMDKSPLSVHPKVPIDSVMDIFKKMGPRYVLVTYYGQLVGIITKKDVLTFLYSLEDKKAGKLDKGPSLLSSSSGNKRASRNRTRPRRGASSRRAGGTRAENSNSIELSILRH